MSTQPVPPVPPDRAEVVAMLAAFGDRPAEDVGDRIGSLELTWLITQVEQRYSVTLDLSDDDLDQMMTIAGAVATLRETLATPGNGQPAGSAQPAGND